MKRKLIKSLLPLSVLLAGAMLLPACSDDKEVDEYSVNYIYINEEDVMLPTQYDIQYSPTGIVFGAPKDTVYVTPVRSRKPAPQDIKVTFSIDEVLLAEYNKENKTDYIVMPEVSLFNNVLTIPKGKYISADTLKLVYSDRVNTAFTDGKHKLLPLRITTVSDGVISVRSKLISLYNLEAVLMDVTEAPIGTLVPTKSTWTAVSSPPSWQGNRALLDGSKNSSVFAYNANQEVTATINFNDTQKVRSIQLEFYKADYSATSVSIEIEVDGVFKSLGKYDLSSFAESDHYYFDLLETYNATAVKVTMSNKRRGTDFSDIYFYE